jgi:hypothetical protein
MLTTDLSYISLILQTFFTIGDGAKKIGGVPPSSFILRPPLHTTDYSNCVAARFSITTAEVL